MMIYLGLSIIGAIILVGVVIRRLPYLRTNRLGLEITSPRQFAMKHSPSGDIWQKVTSFWQSLTVRRQTVPVEITENPIYPTSYTPQVSVEANRTATVTAAIEMPKTAHPGDFWQDDGPNNTPAPLDLPSKGLISRRGEAQKIAHELISQADEAFRKKDFKKSESYYLQAATKDPDNARIYNRLGVIYLQTKNYKDAVEAFKGALKFDDRVASRHFNIALAFLGKRDYRSAEKSLGEAIRLDPTNEKYRKTLLAIQRQPVA